MSARRSSGRRGEQRGYLLPEQRRKKTPSSGGEKQNVAVRGWLGGGVASSILVMVVADRSLGGPYRYGSCMASHSW
ncbi:hypothetical protein ACLOJK_005401 [Asimina triloba]